MEKPLKSSREIIGEILGEIPCEIFGVILGRIPERNLGSVSGETTRGITNPIGVADEFS